MFGRRTLARRLKQRLYNTDLLQIREEFGNQSVRIIETHINSIELAWLGVFCAGTRNQHAGSKGHSLPCIFGSSWRSISCDSLHRWAIISLHCVHAYWAKLALFSAPTPQSTMGLSVNSHTSNITVNKLNQNRTNLELSINILFVQTEHSFRNSSTFYIVNCQCAVCDVDPHCNTKCCMKTKVVTWLQWRNSSHKNHQQPTFFIPQDLCNCVINHRRGFAIGCHVVLLPVIVVCHFW